MRVAEKTARVGFKWGTGQLGQRGTGQDGLWGGTKHPLIKKLVRSDRGDRS